ASAVAPAEQSPVVFDTSVLSEPEVALPTPEPAVNAAATAPVELVPVPDDRPEWPPSAVEPLALATDEQPFVPPTLRPRTPRATGGWFLALVFIPLCTYSILATILVVLLYTRLQEAQWHSPLEELPDLEGEFKGAARQKQSTLSYDRISPDQTLPRHLITQLGQPLRLGDLEVTPQTVELRRLTVRVGTYQPEVEKEPSLVLH